MPRVREVSGVMSYAVATPDPGPLARLEAVKADAQAPNVIFQRLCDGETLKDIAVAWGVPRGAFSLWFMDSHMGLFDAALKVRAGELASETLPIGDEVEEDRDAVAKAKLRVETRLRLAGHWDRSRYGAAKEQGSGGVTVVVDRSCGGTIAVKSGDAQVLVSTGGASSERVIGGAEASVITQEAHEIHENEGEI